MFEDDREPTYANMDSYEVVVQGDNGERLRTNGLTIQSAQSRSSTLTRASGVFGSSKSQPKYAMVDGHDITWQDETL